MIKIETLKIGWFLTVFTTNCYVVSQGKDCVVIDPPLCQKEYVFDYLQKNNLVPQAILLSHGHCDHCGGVEQLLKKYNVPVYCHQNDLQLASIVAYNPFKIPADNCFPQPYPSMSLDFGSLHFDVVETFGHTQGSVLLLLEDKMFSGDTLFYRSIGRTDFPESDINLMNNSVEKLKTFTKDYVVFPGHGETTTLFDELQNNPYLIKQ